VEDVDLLSALPMDRVELEVHIPPNVAYVHIAPLDVDPLNPRVSLHLLWLDWAEAADDLARVESSANQGEKTQA
jgi:hypothetical protein